MIEINNKKYNDFNVELNWGNFSVIRNGIKINGVAPRIYFKTEEFYIMLELIFSDEMFRNAELNKKINLNNYITDVCYDDKDGWISIVTEEYETYLTRISNNEFTIDFKLNSLCLEKCIKIHSNFELIF